LHPRSIDLSLGRIERLLARLGNPETRLPPVVHVAGTNGKGSVIAFIRAILEAQGLRVHVYTSPHLVRFNERIVVAGTEISDKDLERVLDECEAVNSGEPITFFEITTAAAFQAFALMPADLTLLETGLGGRLDATNVVARPILTALTPISIDHQAYLGETLAEIAGEKAGILKPGVTCVVATQPPEAAHVVRRCALSIGAPLIWEGADWSTKFGVDSLIFEDRERSFHLPVPGLAGAHQIANAGTAVACVRRLPGLTIGDEAIGRGLTKVVWPARLQRLGSGPLASSLPADWELWLDGGHNPAAGEALAAQALAWRDKPLHVVFGALKNKDVKNFLAPLAAHVERAIAVTIPGEPNSLNAAEAAAVASTVGLNSDTALGVEDALAKLATATSGPARVLICGSLYLAGAVLAANESR
jgi:dihydrofolate synthase/folylpolyglutamate synthase